MNMNIAIEQEFIPAFRNNFNETYPNGQRKYVDSDFGKLRFALDTYDKAPAAFYRKRIMAARGWTDYELIKNMCLHYSEQAINSYFDFFNPDFDRKTLYGGK